MTNRDDNIAIHWQSAFLQVVQRHEHATALRESALNQRLRAWTGKLTNVIVATCQELEWQASARNNKLDLLPISRSEYLSLDVVAFSTGDKRWRFPVAVFELENSKQDDQIAYSLWKVLCVRAELRVVFCYRVLQTEGSQLVQYLRDEVIQAMDLERRTNLSGQTMVVVGHRGDAETFPFGYFKWWSLEQNTSTFRLM